MSIIIIIIIIIIIFFYSSFLSSFVSSSASAQFATEMVGNVLVDLRNVYEPSAMREAGFHYVSIGR